MIVVSSTTVTLPGTTPPIQSAVGPALFAVKPEPVMVRLAPPDIEPLGGVTAVTEGAG